MLDHHPAAAPAPENGTVARPVSDRPLSARASARIASSRLLAGARELVIEHAGQEYRLRLTRNDKLILTK